MKTLNLGVFEIKNVLSALWYRKEFIEIESKFSKDLFSSNSPLLSEKESKFFLCKTINLSPEIW
ncbi:hypothetical protein AEM51_12595 [Bacteroidetes bacterium UKL13-3]|nr:hypothetical protein AEM51_12595 [Bacteroidetes bacterium UKL13-3]